jgi:hypothetical protein
VTAGAPRPYSVRGDVPDLRPPGCYDSPRPGVPIVKCPKCGGLFSAGSTFRGHQLERHPSGVDVPSVGDALEAIRRATP